MMEELQEPKVLDLHETKSSPTPFALFTWMDEKTINTLQSIGVEKAVEISYTPGCGINHYGGVEVETGPRGTQKSIEQAYKVLRKFLINNNAIKGDGQITTPEIYSVYSVEERPSEAFQAKVENFEKIDSGQVFATSQDGDLEAQESFVPVLFAESYPEIFGFKAVRLEKVEERIYQQEEDKK